MAKDAVLPSRFRESSGRRRDVSVMVREYLSRPDVAELHGIDTTVSDQPVVSATPSISSQLEETAVLLMEAKYERLQDRFLSSNWLNAADYFLDMATNYNTHGLGYAEERAKQLKNQSLLNHLLQMERRATSIGTASAWLDMAEKLEVLMAVKNRSNSGALAKLALGFYGTAMVNAYSRLNNGVPLSKKDRHETYR